MNWKIKITPIGKSFDLDKLKKVLKKIGDVHQNGNCVEIFFSRKNGTNIFNQVKNTLKNYGNFYCQLFCYNCKTTKSRPTQNKEDF